MAFVFPFNYWCGFCFCFQLLLWLLFLLSTILVALFLLSTIVVVLCFCFQLLLWFFVFAFNYCCGSLFLLSTIVSAFFQLLVLFFGNYWGPQSYQGSSVIILDRGVLQLTGCGLRHFRLRLFPISSQCLHFTLCHLSR